MDAIKVLLALVLPRFVQEGKKYATIAVGCTGGRHRSVHIVELLAENLPSLFGSAAGGKDLQVIVTHRELERQGIARPREVANLSDHGARRKNGSISPPIIDGSKVFKVT